jgi:hypothetical protein
MVDRGLIVLGDVSGYTEFVATTELEHSREILGELLGTLCAVAPGNLRVAQLEGDAVFWLSDEHCSGLIPCLKEKFVEFHRRLRFMTLATTCDCRACVAVAALTLKFVVHRGEYVQQRVGGSDHFVGSDIVLAHRLLKNSVPSHEYILVTGAAAEALGAEAAVEHQEHVEYLGTVRCAWLSLGGLRAQALAERTEHLGRDEAQVTFERSFPLAPDRIRRAMRDETFRGIGEHLELLDDPQGVEDEADRSNARPPLVPRPGMRHVVVQRGARGTALGQETHCHHRADGIRGSILRVMRSEHGPDHSLTTMHVIQESASFYLTQLLSEATKGCRLELRYAWEPLGDPTVQVPDWLDEYVQGLFDQLSVVAGHDSLIPPDDVPSLDTG